MREGEDRGLSGKIRGFEVVGYLVERLSDSRIAAAHIVSWRVAMI